MVVPGKFRRAPNLSCCYFTVANVHINECAKRRSVCVALLLLIRDLCLKLCAVVLTGDFPTRVPSGSSLLVAPRVSAAFPRSRQPAAPRASPSPPRGSHHCGVPAMSPMVTNGLSVAVSSSCPNRRTSGSS